MTGYLAANGDPCIDVEVTNPLGWANTLHCVIDTGFTGFLSVPILEAFPIGLLLVGTMPVTLADGSTQYKLMCVGKANIGAESHVGTILIEPGGSQTLLGMEFLSVFSKRLIVDPIAGVVELVATAGPPAGKAVAASQPPKPPKPPGTQLLPPAAPKTEPPEEPQKSS